MKDAKRRSTELTISGVARSVVLDLTSRAYSGNYKLLHAWPNSPTATSLGLGGKIRRCKPVSAAGWECASGLRPCTANGAEGHVLV